MDHEQIAREITTGRLSVEEALRGLTSNEIGRVLSAINGMSASLWERCEQTFGKSWKRQLAQKLGISTSQVNRWISGHTPVAPRNVLAIMKVLESE